MVDPARRARILRDLQQDFVPDDDAQSPPSADKRAAYALEHIAFRLGRVTSPDGAASVHRAVDGDASSAAATRAAGKRHFSDAAWLSIPSNGL
jgi:nicotinamidase-related amidase